MPKFCEDVQKAARANQDVRNQDDNQRDAGHALHARERAGLIDLFIIRLIDGRVVTHASILARARTNQSMATIASYHSR
jgi:hypothetical protein